MFKYLILLIFVVPVLLFPQVSMSAGLVPCEGPDCNLCSLVALGQGIINFLIYIGVFLGVIMIAIAGFTLVLSGGNESAKEKAKSRMWNVLVGFVIILLAYLIVETVMFVFTGSSLGTWSAKVCR